MKNLLYFDLECALESTGEESSKRSQNRSKQTEGNTVEYEGEELYDRLLSKNFEENSEDRWNRIVLELERWRNDAVGAVGLIVLDRAHEERLVVQGKRELKMD